MQSERQCQDGTCFEVVEGLQVLDGGSVETSVIDGHDAIPGGRPKSGERDRTPPWRWDPSPGQAASASSEPGRPRKV